MTDETLMRAVREGDLAKLGILFDRHHPALFDFLCRTTGNRAAAEDLVQDVFLRILKYRATYRDEARFDTWLFRIARNARADYFKQRATVAPLTDEAREHPDRAPGPDRQLEDERDALRLRRALMSLRDDKRELIVLARYRAMKHAQIAELLEVDPGTVKVRLHRALAELRAVFMRLPDGGESCVAKTYSSSL